VLCFAVARPGKRVGAGPDSEYLGGGATVSFGVLVVLVVLVVLIVPVVAAVPVESELRLELGEVESGLGIWRVLDRHLVPEGTRKVGKEDLHMLVMESSSLCSKRIGAWDDRRRDSA